MVCHLVIRPPDDRGLSFVVAATTTASAIRMTGCGRDGSTAAIVPAAMAVGSENLLTKSS